MLLSTWCRAIRGTPIQPPVLALGVAALGARLSEAQRQSISESLADGLERAGPDGIDDELRQGLVDILSSASADHRPRLQMLLHDVRQHPSSLDRASETDR